MVPTVTQARDRVAGFVHSKRSVTDCDRSVTDCKRPNTDWERSLTLSRDALLGGVTPARELGVPLGEWGTTVMEMQIPVSDWTFPRRRAEASVCTDMCTVIRTGRSDFCWLVATFERERPGTRSGGPARECKLPVRDRGAPVAPTGTTARDCVTRVSEEREAPLRLDEARLLRLSAGVAGDAARSRIARVRFRYGGRSIGKGGWRSRAGSGFDGRATRGYLAGGSRD
jgi:hypothetical protein